MGLRRLAGYYKRRTIRIPASEHSIAAGLAFGCLVSWTPTFGTHLIQCAIFSWISKTNLLAGFVGSAFGNPWTTPMLMIISYHVGKALFIATGHGDFIAPDANSLTLREFMRTLIDGDFTWSLLTANFHELFLPTLVGGYTMGLATFPLFYYPFYYMIKGARAARRLRIEQKFHREAVEVTGQAK